MKFSTLHRNDFIKTLCEGQFDLLIIGGGITGAGIALDAASRGLRTALVEKHDFAFGTSSRSTKLIHGGLRYLKQLEFGLVKEVGSERAVVHQLAPHLVVPEKMLLPLSEKKGLGYWLTSIGLKIYDWLAGVRPADQRRMLTRQQTFRREPLLKKNDIKGGALYAEYRTDDARLTIEIMKTAVSHGTVPINYTEAIEFLYEDEKIYGIKVKDLLTDLEYQIKAITVVNAAGPWVDELREINHSKQGKRLHLTKGVHIVVPYIKLPVKQAIYFDVDDGRMIFAIPRGRSTYIGTTDTNYDGNKDEVFAIREEAAYLVNAVNATFPDVSLKVDDVESSWAGIRPLIHEEGKSASELSRKDEIFESTTGLISIAGGKLTGYRKMAERVVNLVIKKYFSSRTLKPCSTQNIKLTQPYYKNIAEVRQAQKKLQMQLTQVADAAGLASYLLENYGVQSQSIVTTAKQQVSIYPLELRVLLAEVNFCIKEEMTVNVLDFFIRRTGLLYFNIEKVKLWNEVVVNEFARLLAWDESTVAKQKLTLAQMIQRVSKLQ